MVFPTRIGNSVYYTLLMNNIMLFTKIRLEIKIFLVNGNAD